MRLPCSCAVQTFSLPERRLTRSMFSPRQARFLRVNWVTRISRLFRDTTLEGRIGRLPRCHSLRVRSVRSDAKRVDSWKPWTQLVTASYVSLEYYIAPRLHRFQFRLRERALKYVPAPYTQHDTKSAQTTYFAIPQHENNQVPNAIVGTDGRYKLFSDLYANWYYNLVEFGKMVPCASLFTSVLPAFNAENFETDIVEHIAGKLSIGLADALRLTTIDNMSVCRWMFLWIAQWIRPWLPRFLAKQIPKRAGKQLYLFACATLRYLGRSDAKRVDSRKPWTQWFTASYVSRKSYITPRQHRFQFRLREGSRQNGPASSAQHDISFVYVPLQNIF